jgi:hypothetical protein
VSSLVIRALAGDDNKNIISSHRSLAKDIDELRTGLRENVIALRTSTILSSRKWVRGCLAEVEAIVFHSKPNDQQR